MYVASNEPALRVERELELGYDIVPFSVNISVYRSLEFHGESSVRNRNRELYSRLLH